MCVPTPTRSMVVSTGVSTLLPLIVLLFLVVLLQRRLLRHCLAVLGISQVVWLFRHVVTPRGVVINTGFVLLVALI